MNKSDPASVPCERRRRPPLRRLGLIGVVLICATLLGLEILFAASATSETGCGFCHVPSAADGELSRSSHRGTACSRCHRLPGVSGAARYNLQAADNLINWLARRPVSPGGQATTIASACRRCHEGLADAPVTVGVVRMSHKQVMGSVEGDAGTKLIPCTSCHARVAHGPAPGGTASLDPHSTCLGCHDGLTASKECATCHTVAASTQPASGDSASDPHPGGWALRHGMGDQSICSLCHRAAYCQGCHAVSLPHDPESYMYTHGNEAVSGSKACLSCHDQASCNDCHKMPMPHPDEYLQQHGKQASDRGTDVCLGCHAPDGCATCHLRHLHPGVPDSVREKLDTQSKAAHLPATSTTSATSPGS